MRWRFTFLFLLMVAVPLGLLAWLGYMMARQDAARVREAWVAGLGRRIDLVDGGLLQEMNRLGSDFDALLQGAALDEAALRALPREQPLIRHAFLLDARSRLVFPRPSSDASGEVAAFLRRTAPVWESGVRFGPQLKEAPVVVANDQTLDMNSSNRWATYVRNKEGRPLVKGDYNKEAPAPAESGWHVWFYGNGAQMLFWQQRNDGRVVGVEVEMAALLSLLVNRLGQAAASAPSDEFWRLVNADGAMVIHQWGSPPAGKPGAVPPAVRRACSAPLSMWHLEAYAGRRGVPRGNVLPVLMGAGAAGLALLGLAWMLYREGTREMREARRRVSFVNQVSHELKTPLTNIRLYAEMAQQQAEAAGEESVVRHLAVVEAETSRLGRLIHNVLTFARHQRDQLAVHPQRVVLDDLVSRALDLWRPGLEAKGFEVKTDLRAPEPFLFDPDAVEQILGNLLSNVEKYAGAGRWLRLATEAGPRMVRLVVEDHGPGVPKAKKDAIFQPFVRLRNDLAEGASGTGIGLAISRELSQLHGGGLTLDETWTEGARFVITLPNKQS